MFIFITVPRLYKDMKIHTRKKIFELTEILVENERSRILVKILQDFWLNKK